MAEHQEAFHVVGGVDTHKDLHVAAVVDHRDHVLGTESFATTRHGYKSAIATLKPGQIRRCNQVGSIYVQTWSLRQTRCGSRYSQLQSLS